MLSPVVSEVLATKHTTASDQTLEVDMINKSGIMEEKGLTRRKFEQSNKRTRGSKGKMRMDFWGQ